MPCDAQSWGCPLPISVGQGIQLVQTIHEMHPQSWSHDHSRYWMAYHVVPQIISSNECHCINIINHIRMNGFDRHGYKQANVSLDNGWLANSTEFEVNRTCIIDSDILKKMPGVMHTSGSCSRSEDVI